MLKFGLKNILSRVILGESWRERDNLDYLCAGLEHNTLASHSHVCTGSTSDANGEEDDRNSINSFSTTATTTNLPGAGRTVDTYIYQPVGRGIERFAKRLSSRRRTGSENIDAGVIHSTTAAADADDNDNSASSINSFSTTATADNLPGTGRAVDTFIFQPMGRRIERLAMRFTITSLHPARIAQYIEAIDGDLYHTANYSKTLNVAIADICSYYQNGSTVVAGLKGLVKQTQSNSIDRSAPALAALIRVSLNLFLREIYANIFRIEPMFHLETLTGSLDHSHPEKKWLLLLSRLARETLIAIQIPLTQYSFHQLLRQEVGQLQPSPETALNLRQRLRRALIVYRSSSFASLDNTIGEACAVCAEAVSTCIDSSAHGGAYMHILETVYLTVIFIFRSIHELADSASISANRNICMVVRTLTYWMDFVVNQYIRASRLYFVRFEIDRLKIDIAFRSLVLVHGDALPESFERTRNTPMLDKFALPRMHRQTAEWAPPIQSLIKTADQRTRRLLLSFDELEREVWGCASLNNITTSQFGIAADPYWTTPSHFGYEWWEYWERTLEQAQEVQVSVNELTEEFREARRIGFEGYPADAEELKWCHDRRNWAYYQLRRLSRHECGQYLRSNMDWDWDLGTCMRHLFKVEPTREEHTPLAQCSPATYSEIDVDDVQGATWRLEAQGSLPKEVQIAYKTETGETQYMSFAPTCPSPRHCPASERSSAGFSEEEGFDPTVVQQELGHRKAASCEEQEIKDLVTSASSSDASPPEACDETPVKSKCDSEGKGPTYDVRFDGVRMGGDDSISICSLN